MTIPVLPLPQSIELTSGDFVLSGRVIMKGTPQADVARIVGYLADVLAKYGVESKTGRLGDGDAGDLLLELDPSSATGPESYSLTITTNRLHLVAEEAAGLFYGVQTLVQLLPVDYEEEIILPCLKIQDAPAFGYRGMHLDVARHFMPKEFILKFIDYLAALKYNVFHWHLTDDQGWRIEIKQYPKLTGVGAWRKETLIGHATSDTPPTYDGKQHGGYYSQDDIREIVRYAADRFITIIPEIEMPGHAQAAIAAYPELGCTDEAVEVWTHWGVSPYLFNVKDVTFTFLENVLSEVMDLFPGPYLHIGGDEAIKDQWIASDHVQNKIKELGLKDGNELQGWFIKRIQRFVSGRGRTIIGWDEILEGGLAPNAVVMSWRGYDGGIDAARKGHDVIMTPGSHCYFDHYQRQDPDEPLAIGGYTPLDQVYAFDPVPEELTEEERGRVLGAQGNVWTEYMPNPAHVEYMVFPRIIALSEVLWTYDPDRDYHEFMERLVHYRNVLDRDGVTYATTAFTEDNNK